MRMSAASRSSIAKAGLRDSGLLEVVLVEALAESLLGLGHRRKRTPRNRRDGNTGKSAREVADEVEYRILVDGIRAVGGAVAALVGRDYAVSRRRERVDLMPPRVPALRPAVQEQDEGPVALLGDVHVDSVERDVKVGYQDSFLDRSDIARLDQFECGLRRYFSPVAARW